MVDPLERFDEAARRARQFAEEEARQLGATYIGTEHLLLGLLRDGESVTAHVLGEFGVAYNQVRPLVAMAVRGQPTTGGLRMSSGGRPPGEPPGDDVPIQPSPQPIAWSVRARTALDLADQEARNLGHAFIGSGHLLLGLLSEGEGMAAGLLQSFGVRDFTAVRKRVLAELG